MQCPKCGEPIAAKDKYCMKCGTPLSDAPYQTIDPVEKKSGGKKIVLGIFIAILILGLLAGAGYYIYLHIVKTRCREVTDQIFTAAKTMDLSSFSKEDLPEQLQGETDLKKYIAAQMQEMLRSSELGAYIDVDKLDIDWDQICTEIASEAEYEITDVDADYHSCTVKVHTKNLDFSSLPTVIAKEIESQINDENSTLWESIKEGIMSLFGGESSENEETPDFTDSFVEIYENAKKELPSLEDDGSIVYGIKDGKWTILSIDEHLFYSFYGFPAQNQ